MPSKWCKKYEIPLALFILVTNILDNPTVPMSRIVKAIEYV